MKTTLEYLQDIERKISDLEVLKQDKDELVRLVQCALLHQGGYYEGLIDNIRKGLC